MGNADTSATRFAAGLIRKSVARSTHQALAFDALAALDSENAERWRRMFLRHARTFALGADAPDVEFRDFRNHLLFPADGFRGGAIAKAQGWYQNLVAALTKREWQNAVYCAGVLSHYIADTVHPLHTAQSTADNEVYAALELATWVIYPDQVRRSVAVAPLGLNDEFLSDALKAGAVAAHSSYLSLLAHIDLMRTAAKPATGLDATGRVIVAGYLTSATGLFAATLSRAIAQSAVQAPDYSLVFSAAKALFTRPVAAFAGGLATRRLCKSVRDMATERAVEGRVEKTLPEEVRVKREFYARDVQPVAMAPSGNVVAFEPSRQSLPRDAGGETEEAVIVDIRRQRRPIEQPRPAPARTVAEPIRVRIHNLRSLPSDAEPAGVMGVEVANIPAAARAASPQAAALGQAAAAMLAPFAGGSNFRDRRAASGTPGQVGNS